MEPMSLLCIDGPPPCALVSSFLTQLLFHVFVHMCEPFQTVCTFPSSTLTASYFKAACLQWPSSALVSPVNIHTSFSQPSASAFFWELFLLFIPVPEVTASTGFWFRLTGPRTLSHSIEVAKTLLLISQPPLMILWSFQHQGWSLTHSSAERISDFMFVNGWMYKCTRGRLQG